MIAFNSEKPSLSACLKIQFASFSTENINFTSKLLQNGRIIYNGADSMMKMN